MKRRAFIAAGITLLAAPLAAEGQATTSAKIGFLLGGTVASPNIHLEPFKQALHEKGWTEGQNLTLEYRYAEGQYERLFTLARELLDARVDVIVTEGTPPTRAAMQATKTVPIVMATTGDPVRSGFVNSLAHPGGNVTGASYFFSDIHVKRIELLKEAAPKIARVAVVYNPASSLHEPAVVAIEASAKSFKIHIQRMPVRAPADFDAIFPVMTRQRMDAVTVLEDPMIHSRSARVVEAALRGRVPALVGLSGLVEAGGLMSYGPNRPDMWRRAAGLTDKILRGAKPGDLPVEQPTKFELVINLKTAKALGLTIPPSLLLRADQVIE